LVRLTLDDGRWLDCRLPTTDEFLDILDSRDGGDDDPRSFVTQVRLVRDAMNAACEATSWGGRPSDLPPATLARLLPRWLNAAEDDALPPASGTSSGTT